MTEKILNEDQSKMEHKSLDSIWEQPEMVTRFADRDPDIRLMDCLSKIKKPSTYRVLDLGCAGGRNTEVLARMGFDLHALDASEAMVAKTRERTAAFLDSAEVSTRISHGFIDDLSRFPDSQFHLIIALGIYHNAMNRNQWESSLKESIRVLKTGGRLLVACFSPGSQPHGKPMDVVPGKPDVYIGFTSRAMYLKDASAMDAELKTLGMIPCVPTETKKRITESGYRLTVNALYCKK